MSKAYEYIIVDCANRNILAENAFVYYPHNSCILEYGNESHLKTFAPFLFSIEDTDSNNFVEENFGLSGLVFFRAGESIDQVMQHLRKLMSVQMNNGQQVYFRFYDPRVLRIFLPSCSKEQLTELFGPIKMFIIEDEDPAFALQYWLQNSELRCERYTASEFFSEILTKNSANPDSDDDSMKNMAYQMPDEEIKVEMKSKPNIFFD